MISMATRNKRTTAVAEPAVPTVLVQWVRNAPLQAVHPLLGYDPTASGAADIGGRRYGGRLGERAEIRSDDAEILVRAGFVRSAAEAEQVASPAT